MTAARWRMAASWATTVLPSMDICSIPARCFFSSVATRTMKNSSRFEETIARNFTRSSNG